MDRKEVLNSPRTKFLIPVCQIYVYPTLPSRGLYHLKINQMSTQETGLDWITFSTSHQIGWIECILNIPDYKNILL